MNDREYLQRAIDISRNSPPCGTAYRVGAVIVTAPGAVFEGYTHETSRDNHAEEEAIKKALAAGADMGGATIYSSMEPCSTRRSKPVSCAELIVGYGFGRVVYASGEPDCFADCEGTARLLAAGVAVDTFPDMAAEVREINSHILP